MTRAKLPRPIPRVALDPDEAAAALGVGRSFFDEQIRPEVRVIRRGAKRLYPLAELEKWAQENSEKVLSTDGEGR